jgi:hypothetical protein
VPDSIIMPAERCVGVAFLNACKDNVKRFMCCQVNDILLTVSRESRELEDRVEKYVSFMKTYKFLPHHHNPSLTPQPSVLRLYYWLNFQLEGLDLFSGL